MEKIAKFYKVSEKQFTDAYVEEFNCTLQQAKEVYANIKLPKRATTGRDRKSVV